MLLRFAKIVGGLRLLITETGPLLGTSVALLSARSLAYIVGFGLGSIVSSWLPIIFLLVSITGFFEVGGNTPECEAYRAQMRAIDNANRVAFESWQLADQAYIDGPYKNYLLAAKALALSASQQAKSFCANRPHTDTCIICGGGGIEGFTCVSSICSPRAQCEDREFTRLNTGLTIPSPPPFPEIQTYPACSSPDCPPGKKLWTQVIWGNPSGNASEPKGCFIVAYSQDAPTLDPEVEYNPFLPDAFVRSRAISYHLVDGDKYRALEDNDWNDLESVQGWDKGYWRSEVVDPECRGWRPGWSKIVK